MQSLNLSRRRRGFTLVEILTVIAIIAILAALGTWGVFAMMGSQQRRNSESSLKVIDKLLHDRWSAVIADAKKETPSPQVMMLAGGDPARARVIWIKVRLAEAFPVNYNEVLQSLGPPPPAMTIVNAYIPPNQRKPHFAKYQSLLAGKAGGGIGESSACLLMALKTLASDGVSVEDQLKTFVADKDGDGVPELIDGWGNPLAFYRFPTGANVQAINPAKAPAKGATFADPIDSDGLLLNRSWYLTSPPPNSPNPLRVQFEGNANYQPFHPVALVAPPAANAAANYTIPFVVSPGKDGKMSLAPDGSPTTAQDADNIFSYTLRGN